jgi:predicted DNA-binding protein (MmcQ/YjbR family)
MASPYFVIRYLDYGKYEGGVGKGAALALNIESIQTICRKWPGVTEDVKWGDNLVFSVGGKMFATIDLEPPHAIAFKCSDEQFVELLEREGIVPAPYLARAKWVQETELGETLDRRELETLLRQAYDIVSAKLSKPRRSIKRER